MVIIKSYPHTFCFKYRENKNAEIDAIVQHIESEKSLLDSQLDTIELHTNWFWAYPGYVLFITTFIGYGILFYVLNQLSFLIEDRNIPDSLIWAILIAPIIIGTIVFIMSLLKNRGVSAQKALRRRALKAICKVDLHSAELILADIIKKEPTDIEAPRLLAHAYAWFGRYDDALACLDWLDINDESINKLKLDIQCIQEYSLNSH